MYSIAPFLIYLKGSITNSLFYTVPFHLIIYICIVDTWTGRGLVTLTPCQPLPVQSQKSMCNLQLVLYQQVLHFVLHRLDIHGWLNPWKKSWYWWTYTVKQTPVQVELYYFSLSILQKSSTLYILFCFIPCFCFI